MEMLTTMPEEQFQRMILRGSIIVFLVIVAFYALLEAIAEVSKK